MLPYSQRTNLLNQKQIPLFLNRLQCIYIYIYIYIYIFVFGVKAPQWAMASSFPRLLDHTQRRTTVGRTPLDEWTARRRDLYLKTHNTHKRHSCPRWDSNPQSQQASGLRRIYIIKTAVLFRHPTRTITYDQPLLLWEAFYLQSSTVLKKLVSSKGLTLFSKGNRNQYGLHYISGTNCGRD